MTNTYHPCHRSAQGAGEHPKRGALPASIPVKCTHSEVSRVMPLSQRRELRFREVR